MLLRPRCPTEGQRRRQDRDLALALHHHMPEMIPDDRHRSEDADLPGGVTVFLLLFPINN